MTDIDILNTSWKTEVTPEQSAEIQRLLFKHGVRWGNNTREVSNTDSAFLFYYHYSNLIRHTKDDKEHFEIHSGIEIAAPDIIAALRKLEEGEKPVSEETNDDGWIDFENEMPSLNKEFETKYIDEDKNEYFGKSKFYLTKSNNIDFIVTKASYRTDSHLKCWRYPREKRPDFGKLREGDFIVIELNNNIKTSGFCQRDTDDTFVIIYSYSNNGFLTPHNTKNIKKITRINLETREFEEI